MSLYRCEKCGSKNVNQVTEKGGFSYGKAIAGTIVFGEIGAVAGINGKEKTIFKCQDCGHTSNFPMSESVKTAIDLCVSNAEIRGKIMINGSYLPWNSVKAMYPNIENGLADDELNSEIIKSQQRMQLIGSASLFDFNKAIDVVVEFCNKYLSNWMKPLLNGILPTIEEFSVFRQAEDTIALNLPKMKDMLPKSGVYRGLYHHQICGCLFDYCFYTFRDVFHRYPSWSVPLSSDYREYEYHYICDDFINLINAQPVLKDIMISCSDFLGLFIDRSSPDEKICLAFLHSLTGISINKSGCMFVDSNGNRLDKEYFENCETDYLGDSLSFKNKSLFTSFSARTLLDFESNSLLSDIFDFYCDIHMPLFTISQNALLFNKSAIDPALGKRFQSDIEFSNLYKALFDGFQESRKEAKKSLIAINSLTDKIALNKKRCKDILTEIDEYERRFFGKKRFAAEIQSLTSKNNSFETETKQCTDKLNAECDKLYKLIDSLYHWPLVTAGKLGLFCTWKEISKSEEKNENSINTNTQTETSNDSNIVDYSKFSEDERKIQFIINTLKSSSVPLSPYDIVEISDRKEYWDYGISLSNQGALKILNNLAEQGIVSKIRINDKPYYTIC